jgi:hypothetical protein
VPDIKSELKKQLRRELRIARGNLAVVICTPRRIREIVSCEVVDLATAKLLGGEALKRHTKPKAMVVITNHIVTAKLPRESFERKCSCPIIPDARV